MVDKKRAKRIYAILKKKYPNATTALTHRNAHQLLVATVLSAQCTDKRVNIVTKYLFKKYKSVKDFASAEQEELEKDIRSTGFYRNKAKNIIASSKKIVSEYKYKVPATMDALLTLPGVARKTANIVLFHAFGKSEGIAVDTHVKRLSARLGLSEHENPEKIEQDLMRLLDRPYWGNITNLLIAHGRKICIARKPVCAECVLGTLCPSKNEFLKK